MLIKTIIASRIAAFERTYDYDMTYARELLTADTKAFLAFAKLTAISQYRRDVPTDVWYAAKVVAAMAEDCGPCTQLVVTMAQRDGVPAHTIAAVIHGDDSALPRDVSLGVSFTRSSLAHDPAADALREQIIATWGKRAVISLAFAMASARLFPTVKYALGFGHACRRVIVAGAQIDVAPGAA